MPRHTRLVHARLAGTAPVARFMVRKLTLQRAARHGSSLHAHPQGRVRCRKQKSFYAFVRRRLLTHVLALGNALDRARPRRMKKKPGEIGSSLHILQMK